MVRAQGVASVIIAATLAITGLPSVLEAQVAAQTRAVDDETERKAVGYSWEDGQTTLRFSKAEVRISNRVQFLWTDEREEGLGAERSIDIPRARTKAGGWIASEHLTYEVQFDWAEGPELEDLFVSWDVSRTKAFEIELGQFKVPFGRERLTSSGALQFVDRSIVAGEFTRGRDVGLQVKGLVADRRMEYRMGVFNGAGQNTLGDQQGLQYNGRLMFQPFGAVNDSEGDLEWVEGPLLAIAGNFDVNHRRPVSGAERRRRITVGADAALHYRGVSLTAEFFVRAREPEAGASSPARGFLVQAGYFVVPCRLEIAGRLATWDPTAPVPAYGEREIGLASGYFVNGHNLKLQSDLRRLDNGRDQPARHEFRVQLQVAF